jgi:hypothetical protein
MLALYLLCPECSSAAKNIDPSFDLDPHVSVAWTCKKDHTWISGWRAMHGAWEHLRITPDNAMEKASPPAPTSAASDLTTSPLPIP